jgi:hypothetical protein
VSPVAPMQEVAPARLQSTRLRAIGAVSIGTDGPRMIMKFVSLAPEEGIDA